MNLDMYRGLVYVYDSPGEDDQAFAQRIWRQVSSSASYHSGHKRWRIPLSHGAVRELKAMGATLPDSIKHWLKRQDQLDKARDRANLLKEKVARPVREWMAKQGVREKKPLFDHQVISTAYGLMLPACGMFLDTGCGKTAVASTIMQALVDHRGLGRTLVMAPKSILDTSWGEDIDDFSWLKWVNISDSPRRPEVTTCPRCGKIFKKHVTWRHLRTHLKKSIERMGEKAAKAKFFAGHPELVSPAIDDKRMRLLRALDSDAQVFLINPEGFKLVIGDLMDQDWDMMIIDESSVLKSHDSQITNKTIEFGSMLRRKICMTATPRPNSSLDYWGQMAFLDQSLGGSFTAFRKKYYYSDHNGWTWTAKSESDFIIRDIVFERSIRFRLDDCVDLPGETYEKMEVTLTSELADHYADMEKKMMVQLDDGDTVETSWLIVQMNKLAQITSGFVFDDNGNAVFLGDSPKIQATVDMAKRLVDSEDRSVVIWIRFQEEAKLLQAALEKLGVSTMHGGTKNHKASAEAFKSRKNRVMIAHPQSAKFGHTWVVSNVDIFHSYGYSWEDIYQAKRRIYRIGQDKPVTHMSVIAKGTVDEIIIDKVLQKEAESEATVDEGVIDRLQRLADKVHGRSQRRRKR